MSEMSIEDGANYGVVLSMEQVTLVYKHCMYFPRSYRGLFCVIAYRCITMGENPPRTLFALIVLVVGLGHHVTDHSEEPDCC